MTSWQPQHDPGRQQRRPPYPARAVRFPAGMLPRAGRNRGRSFWRLVYLGSHPVAAIFALCVNAAAAAVVIGWIAIVGSAWAVWVMLVTGAWLCRAAVASVRR
jgi:fatty acid desaturase